MGIIEFYDTVKAIRDIKREGWVNRGVSDPENVAEHSFMMAILCVVLPAEGIDRDRAIKMALVHDLAESVIGDRITKENWPSGGTITESEKHGLEENALKKMLTNLDNDVSGEILELWREFEAGKTEEARFVKDIDVAQRTIQAIEYHKKGDFREPLEGFWGKRNLDKIKDKSIKSLVENIIPMGR